ncbi:hypothetical protein [Streptomyces turgidiscabies]|uniref:hypothetical protein n=1 Tax=Streptomyces turgidiscabies TaxID=85558 RepID=UPI0038F68CA0
MDFILNGRDRLSRVLDRAGDASDRLGRRLLTMSINGDAAVRRFTNNSTRNLAALQRDTEAGGKSLEQLKKATLLLAPAAIPAAASLVPIAAGAGAVAVAAGVMAVALGPQIAKLGEASEAQKKYKEAVEKSGASSKEAVTAQQEYLRLMASMPPETRRAAVSVGLLKDEFKDWSDSLAGDTMAPVNKGIAITNSLLPKTTGLVKAASGETDRFMTLIGGEVASPGIDRLNSKFTQFAQTTMRKVNDELVHLMRAGSGGNAGGDAREFMDWARAQGPRVADVLKSVSTALMNILQAGSDVGVGLLDVVGMLASLVAAVPPSAISTFLQLALAMKVVKAAALGMVAARTAVAGLAIQLVAMQTASAAAPTRLRSVTAAIGALSRGAKVAMAGTGIGLLLLALGELSARGKQAPPDVDKLTSSLARLGRDGSVSGEAARAFGKDLDGLHGKVRALTDPSTTDKIQQFVVSLGGLADWDSTPVEDAKANIDAIDKSLAGMVSNGQADLAAAAVKRLTAEYGKGGRDTREFTSELGDYRDAIADAKFEAELAAASQGLFGTQAQKTQAALAAQKQSADGLRQSIQALNDVQRAGLGGMIGFEASIDAAAKAAKDNAGALSMSHGQLNLNGEKARAAATALNDLAAKTDEAAAAARDNGASWAAVSGVYTRGRAELIKNAVAMGLNSKEAARLADRILKIPNKTAMVKADVSDLEAKLKTARGKLASVPDSRRAKLLADIRDLERKVATARGELASLRDKKVFITTISRSVQSGKMSSQAAKNAIETYASGGTPKAGQAAIVGEEGPELVVFGQDARVFDAAKTQAMLRGTGSAVRSAGAAGASVGQGLAGGMAASMGLVQAGARRMAAEVTTGIREELDIRSPSKKTRALALDIGRGLIVGLTASRDKIRSVSADLAKDIRAAFSGRKESGLVRMVTAQTNRLLSLAAKRDKIAATIATARKYASDITSSARENAGLSGLGLEADAVSAGSIKGGLASKLAQIKQFTRYIDILAKKGLNKGLLRQILNMGPEAGYAYASALVGADKGTFGQINKLQTQIDKSTTTLGQVGADRLYDAGKNASKGFLKGLESQQKDLERVMQKIAVAMQKALRKALGINSPARVMIPDGINTARGVAVGVLQGLPHVDSAMRAVAGRIAGRAVAMRPAAGRGASSGGGAQQVVYMTVEFKGLVTDRTATAKEIVEVVNELARNTGQPVKMQVVPA